MGHMARDIVDEIAHHKATQALLFRAERARGSLRHPLLSYQIKESLDPVIEEAIIPSLVWDKGSGVTMWTRTTSTIHDQKRKKLTKSKLRGAEQQMVLNNTMVPTLLNEDIKKNGINFIPC